MKRINQNKTMTECEKMYASRESNPGLSLGKATCYHYTTSDSHLQDGFLCRSEPVIYPVALRPRMAMMVLLLAVAALHGADATFPRRASTAAFPHYPQREVFSLTG